jgi:hypothetical protein
MSTVDKDARTMAMLCHLSKFAGYVIPFGNIIAPLVIWMMKKDEMPFVDDQGRESINFNITMMIGYIICIVLMFVVIGIFLIFPLLLLDVILTIVAAVKANDGEYYRYPINIRFL